MLETEIRELLFSCGACAVGFAEIFDCIPSELNSSMKYAVSFAYKMSDSVIFTIKQKPSIMYFQHYRAVNAKLDMMALDVTKYIETQGYNAFPIAASQSRNTKKETYSAVFPHKTAAVRGGIGYIGKNGLLINEKYGSKIRLATVLTDMPFESPHSTSISECGSCNICALACPAGAIKNVEFCCGMTRDDIIDAKKCSEHMKTYTDIGRGAVCGICIAVCPKNSKQKTL